MTRHIDICLAAAQRTEAARWLIARARDGELVDLAVISAMDLCVLGGTGPPLRDEAVARAWSRLGGRLRDTTATAVTQTLLDRGLLIDEGLRTSARPRSGCYLPGPELGLVIAARRHPRFAVRTEAEGQDLRGLRLFGLGDQDGLSCGLVAEVPAGLPPDREAGFPGVRKLGPLGWVYRYVLVSREQAAEVLARWTISPPPPRPGRHRADGYLVSVSRPDGEQSPGVRVRVRGDGACAQVNSPGSQEEAGHDLAALRAVMLGLITSRPGSGAR
jgi:hypothetical protein